MFHTARTSVRTMLVAAGAAGFVALGAGVAGADTLGGVTDDLPLGDLGHQTTTALNEGVITPVGALAKAEPGEISAQPEVQHQSADSTETVGHVIGDGAFATTPVEIGKDVVTDFGLPGLGETTAESLPLSGASETSSLNHEGAVDSLSGLLNESGLLDFLSSDGAQTLPLGHEESPQLLEQNTAVVDDTVRELGSRAKNGVREGDPRLFTLDEVNLEAVDGIVPMSGSTGLGLPVEPSTVGETLPLIAGTDLLGDDLVDVQGLPELDIPEAGTDHLPATEELSLGEGSDLGLDLPVSLL